MDAFRSSASFRKTLAILLILSRSTAVSFGQTSNTSSSGIPFLTTDFQTAFNKAKEAQKPLFVEVYLKGCPHCEALAPVLKEKAVGDFFKESFVSWKTEANSKESSEFQKALGVTYPEFPLLFFVDTDGTLIHIATPVEQTDRSRFIREIIHIGKVALDPLQRTGNFEQRLLDGDRDLMFLINYAKLSKTMKNRQKLSQINAILGKILTTPDEITSQTGFYILQRLVDDIDHPMSVYFFDHLDTFRSKYPAKDVQETGEAILYHSLYGPGGDSYAVSRMIDMRKMMVRLGVSEAEASSRLLIKELDSYMRERNTAGAVKRFEEYRRASTHLGTADYAYMMKYFNEKATDDTYLTSMPVWANEGIRIADKNDANSKQMAGLYFELAEAYKRMGQKNEALKYAQRGLETAKLAKDNIDRFEKQLAGLK